MQLCSVPSIFLTDMLICLVVKKASSLVATASKDARETTKISHYKQSLRIWLMIYSSFLGGYVSIGISWVIVSMFINI